MVGSRLEWRFITAGERFLDAREMLAGVLLWQTEETAAYAFALSLSLSTGRCKKKHQNPN